MFLPPVNININEIVENNYMSPDEVRAYSKFLLDKMSDYFIKQLEKYVGDNLHSTRKNYLEALRKEFVDENNVVFILDGKGESWIAIALELGKAPYDLKDFFEKSPNAHNPGTDKWYMSIPFRMATSEAIAKSEFFSGQIMPKEIHKIAKSGETLTNANIPTELQIKGQRDEIKNFGEKGREYTHKSGKYEGLTLKGDDEHHQYVKFRRVSANSDDNSWIHKGFEAHNFMQRALNDLKSNLEELNNNATDEWFDINR